MPVFLPHALKSILRIDLIKVHFGGNSFMAVCAVNCSSGFMEKDDLGQAAKVVTEYLKMCCVFLHKGEILLSHL